MSSKSTKQPSGRLTRLYLENWRNFSHVDIALERRAIFVGPNASGKSNLLDALRFLREVAQVGGGLQNAVHRRAGVTRLRCLAARRQTDLVIRTSVGDDTKPRQWEYELCFNQDNNRRPIIKREQVWKAGERILNRPDPWDEKDFERLTQTYLEQVHANQEFRELAEFFRSMRYLHLVPQLVREPERFVNPPDDPFGGDFLELVARTNQKTQQARLRRIEKALAVAVPQLKELNLDRDNRGTPHLYGRYEHWRRQGAGQTEEDLSDGTLRLMGLLWSVLDGTGPLLLEEPELSLHPGVIRYLPQMLARVRRGSKRHSGRQILLSTHSSDLLEDTGLGLDEVFLLLPQDEGTVVSPATKFAEIPPLLEGGATLADAVIPRTQPKDAGQLTLFTEEK